VLQEQLQERAKERIRQEELQECERLVIVKEMERLHEEELRQQVEKQMRAKQLVAEVRHSAPAMHSVGHTAGCTLAAPVHAMLQSGTCMLCCRVAHACCAAHWHMHAVQHTGTPPL
jgi:hypothetical protein